MLARKRATYGRAAAVAVTLPAHLIKPDRRDYLCEMCEPRERRKNGPAVACLPAAMESIATAPEPSFFCAVHAREE